MGYPQFPEERKKKPEMSLSIFDLQQIVTQLEKAQKAGVRFTGEMVVGEHLVSVRWEDNQLEGEWLVITGIRHV